MVVPSDADPTPTAAEIDAITTRKFSSSFRGWDPDEVRAHLVGVAEIVRSLTHRQADLQRLLVEAEAAARRADLTRLDPDEVSRVLGEETARVLHAAREAATEIEAKANAQAELLARQAADDAAELRASAETEAKAIRSDAHEVAAATRAAGEAHLVDVRAAAEEAIAADRSRMEQEAAEERQSALDEIATMLATAENHAIQVRRQADEDAARLRSEAEAAVAAQREASDAQIANRQAAAEAKLAEMTARATEQVSEAERMRDRILADLARKRRAARQHLEQLQAGRERLLAAYEIIRGTTDQATGELTTVLSDAKIAADDAARRVASEELPSPEQMLAELDLARMADLPIIADVDAADDDGVVGDVVEAVSAEDAAAGPREDDIPVDDSAPASSDGRDTSDGDSAVESPVVVASDDSAGVVRIVPAEAQRSSPLGSDKEPHRHLGRRSKRRPDPLGGAALPDVPMPAVDASAEFESVRVLAAPVEPAPALVDECDDVADPAKPVAGAAETAVPSGDELPDDLGDRSVSLKVTKSNTGVESKAAPLLAATAGSEGAKQDAAEKAVQKDRANTDPLQTKTADKQGAASDGSEDDVVSDIFARLRAERAAVPAAEVESEAERPDAVPVGVPSGSTGQTETTGAKPGGGTVEAVPSTERPDVAAPSRPVAGAPTPASSAAKSKPKDVTARTGSQTQQTAHPNKPQASGKPETKPQAAPVAAAKKPKKAGQPMAKAGGASPKTAVASATPSDAKLAALFERRDAAVDEVARRLAKHFKRALSDQQSSLLDQLRRHSGAVQPDDVLGTPDAFAGEWVEMIRVDLGGAVAAGVAFAGDLRTDATERRDVDLSEPIDELIAVIADPLRARLVRALGEGAARDDEAVDDLELAERIRACYREWRGARLTESVADASARAFGLGIRSAVPVSIGLRWYCGPGDAPCSDCFDNQLAGEVKASEPFPTGQAVAPAHPGCRCLALPPLA